MALAARERIARLLDDKDMPGGFSTRFTMEPDGVTLTVEGAGPVSLPVSGPGAKKLITVARPAMFGLGERTLTDLSVRDTWEITPERFQLAGLDWDAVFTEVRDGLGLPRGAALRAEPHSMLVYGKGQFFLPHQDSEKHDSMAGTLVMSLPSPHRGGELVIEHNGEEVSCQASASELTFIAFYGDCRHQVLPVKSGYRLTITFNLLLDAAAPGEPEPEPAAELAGYLTEHFTTRPVQRYGWPEKEPPSRLVYLLDHKYTEHSASWSRLKGADAGRGALLRAAAERAGCEAVLGLTQIQETWEGRRCEYLINSEVTLGWLADPCGDGGQAISLYVPDGQVCATTPSAKLRADAREYTGYMGNYGDTTDRWYRRAAVVVWPRDRAFAVRAEASRSWALAELRAMLDAGHLEQARSAGESVASFWKTIDPAELDTALHVAAGLGAGDTAAMLLRPGKAEWLTPEHAGGLAALSGAYGEQWLSVLVSEWFKAGTAWAYPGASRGDWVAALPGLCQALRAVPGGDAAARVLLAASWRWLETDLGNSLAAQAPGTRRERLRRLGGPLAGLLRAAGQDLRATITGSLSGRPDDVACCLIAALRAAGADVGGLAADCDRRLSAIAARPARDAGDWSVPWPGGCTCDRCATLRDFLTDPGRQAFEWPLAEAGRKHVQDRITSAELPVRHETWRYGSPYTLVLTKTEELFRREDAEREQALADLAWLRDSVGTV
jgi:hypothetical protein